ncbi:MAG: sigma-54 dependent transcriptional regulator [Paludibacteraceae bacterium]|nr:sigma-54-dependent Fis family transcriptional regulator [Prevotellaceae bacterium]
MKQILLVEDDITFSIMLKTWLGKRNFTIDNVSSIVDAKKCMEDGNYDIILSDLRLPDEDGISLLEWMKTKNLDVPFIMMTSYAEVQSAVQSMKLGAFDFIAKPINPEELLKKINEAFVLKLGKRKVASSENVAAKLDYIEGTCESARKMHEYVQLVAPTSMSILIIGDSGTGKEYVARLIHEKSDRREAPFVAVDCGAIPSELAANELFGCKKGTVSNALSDKEGHFMVANGGTLFLDEIGNLSYEIQIQLLRVLQEKVIKPVGSDDEISVDVRIIASTNENLPNLLDSHHFREDLYHRINEFSIMVPSLRERREDIILFANHFLNDANEELGKNVIGFDKECMAIFCKYGWPGNLRQLKNVVKRATLLAKDDFITVDLLPSEMKTESGTIESESSALRDHDYEKRKIMKALKECNNNKSQTALVLQIDRKTLYNKMKQYGIFD